jgi:hypothetical protein
MKPGALVTGKKVHLTHFCDECFELVTQKISAGLPVKMPIVHPQKTNGERFNRPFET